VSQGLFDGLDETAREELHVQLRPRVLSAGAVLCRAGDRNDSLYLVERGVLHVLDGNTGTLLGRQRAGDVVGEVALLTGEPRSATLLARVPSVVSELAREAFLALAAGHPVLLANLARIVSRRLVERTTAAPAKITALLTEPAGWAGAETAVATARAASAAPLHRCAAQLAAGRLRRGRGRRQQHRRLGRGVDGAGARGGHRRTSAAGSLRRGRRAVHVPPRRRRRRRGADGAAVMARLARETTADAGFADLAMPLSVLTADLSAQCPVSLTEDGVADALVAAMTMPGLYPPVRRGDQRLVDAVVLTPVPTAAVAGVDVTIAVNLLGHQAMPAWPGEPGPERAARDRDPVVESLELASFGAAAAQTAAASVPVTPRFGPGTWRDFRHADRFLAAGEEAMEQALSRLRALARPGL
jgi:CRP-like cAMP-binding protein